MGKEKNLRKLFQTVIIIMFLYILGYGKAVVITNFKSFENVLSASGAL